MSDERRYIIKLVEAKAETNYDDCRYEGDLPSLDLELSIKDMTLEELLTSLTDYQLQNSGLQRIPKKGKKK
jgi:hypothetical protein